MDTSIRARAWKAAVLTVVITRVSFFVVAWLGVIMLDGDPARGFFEIWDRWDAGILLGIAEFGYTEAADPHPTALMWGYPLLVRLTEPVFGSYLGAGLVVNVFASLVALRYLYRLAEETLGEGAGDRAIIYLALFPTAVFLAAPYTESLFLAGAIASFYYAKAGHLRGVAIGSAVAMSARFAGIFLLVGLLIELLVRRTPKLKSVAAVSIGALPLLGHMVFLAITTGDPFHFLSDQAAGWGRRLVSPFESLRLTLGQASLGDASSATWGIEVAAAVIAVLAVVWAVRRREWGYAAFMGSFTAALLTSSLYLSIPRMLLTYFPIPVALAARLRGLSHGIWIGASATLATIGVLVFTRGGWFF